VTLLYAAGDPVAARHAAERATELGLRLDPRVLSAISPSFTDTGEDENEP
jgi:hypothetical protein